ncbi:MAG TPA: choice-of-anchor J domain-containing protein [candidate division Zixibacteria bacterium]|nr:choice-of-anchor J domain-containing protein [candidate division Zixibacteria bacterium]
MANLRTTIKILVALAMFGGLCIAVVGDIGTTSVQPVGMADDGANWALKEQLAPVHTEPGEDNQGIDDPFNPPAEEIAAKEAEMLLLTKAHRYGLSDRVSPVQSSPGMTYDPLTRVDLLYEGFEDGLVPPTTWTTVVNNAFTWEVSTSSPYEGTYYATCYYDEDYTGNQDEWLITPAVDLTTDGVTWYLDFWWNGSYYWSVDPYANCSLTVYISTDGGSNWDFLWDNNQVGEFTNWTWYEQQIDLTSYNTATAAQFAFVYTGYDGAQFSIDAVSINDAAPPVGRCCYGTDFLTCEDLTEAACGELSGHWSAGLNCTDNPCPTVPENDEPEGAITIEPPATVTGSTAAATIDCEGVLDWEAIWYRFDAPYGENEVHIDYCGTVGDIYTVGVVVYEEALPLDCEAYIIADDYEFVDCGDGYENPNMTFNRLPGPATYLFPVYTDDGNKTGMDFQFSITLSEAEPLPPGASCEDPYTLSFGLADLPTTISGMTTCGMENVYENSCLGYYDGGEDWILEFTLTDDANLKITLDPKGTTYSGMLVADACGDVDPCIDYITGSSGDPKSITGLVLTAGTYYLMVDTWPTPDCIDEFDVTFDVMPEGGAGDNCEDPISVKLPDDMTGGDGSQYVDVNFTCGRVNDYENTCLGYYDGGEDIIYMLDVGTEMAFNFLMTTSTTWTGMMIADACGDVETCVAYVTGSSSDKGIYNQTLSPGIYYLMLDTYPSPDCIDEFTLTIEEAVIVESNDSWEYCESIGDVDSLPFTTTDATPDGPLSCQTAPNKWFCYTATCDGQVTVSLCGSSYDTKLAVYEGFDPLTGTQVGCNDDACSLQSEITGIPCAVGDNFIIEVGGYSTNTGDGILTVYCTPCEAPENDNCEDVTPVVLADGVPVTFYGDNTCATNQCASFEGGHVWEAFTIETMADVTLDYCGTSPAFGNVWLNLAIGCPCADFTTAGTYNTDDCGDGNITIVWESLEAGTYYYPVLLDPDYDAEGPYTITVVAGAPSTFSTNPTSIDFGLQAPGSTGNTDLTLMAVGNFDINYSISYLYGSKGRGTLPYTDLDTQGKPKPEFEGPENIPMTQQGGDDISTAYVIGSIPFYDEGSTEGYTDDYEEVCPYSSTSPDVVYEYTPATDIVVTIDLCASGYDTKLFLYENAVTQDDPFACDDDGCSGSTYRSILENLALTAGNTYYIIIDGYGGDYGDYVLDIYEYEEPDPFACPEGAGTEAEACGDDTNGGCNMDTPAFEPIECGTTICGTVWADGSTRDTDWYLLTLYSTVTVTLNASANYPFIVGFVDTADCSLASALDPYSSGSADDVVAVSREAGPGIYYVFVSASVYEGYPCGTTNDYWLNVDCPPGPVLWLSASPEVGTIPANGSTPITVSYDAAELDEGIYTADLVFTHDGVKGTTVSTVPVTLEIGQSELDTVSCSPAICNVFMENAVEPQTGYIYISDEFDASYGVADIDPTTCVINGSIVPTEYEVGVYPGFNGDVLRLGFDLAAFSYYYSGGGLVWDCTEETYTVTGDYYSSGSFSVSDVIQYCGHISGDLNIDGSVDITDLILLVDYMFNGGAAPQYQELADVNGSGGPADISDLVHWVSWAFQGGPALQHP